MKIDGIDGTFELRNGCKMPYLGLGVYLADDGQEVINAVKWALEAGYRHVDTAAAYDNEEGVGRGIADSGIARDSIWVTSKVWNSDQGYDSTLKACQDSLDRLGTDYLDLYLIHWPVEGLYRETWKAMERLYEEGKVRAIGVSNFLEHHLRDLLDTAKVVPMVNQMEFHPYLVQQELLDFCAAQGIQYEAWSPLMQGNLFGKKEFKELAEKYGKSEAQLVLRWNLQKGVVTIPKSVNRDHIRSNADLFDFSLSEEDMRYLDELDRGQRFGPDPDNFDF